MGAAEVIAFEEVRARKQWDTLVTSSMSALTNGSIPWRRSGTSRRQPYRR